MITTPRSIKLMEGQLSYLDKSGYNVTVVSSPGLKLNEAVEKEGVNIKAIEMERDISLLKDFVSLVKITLYFLKLKPDICNAGTPKAGLLGMIGAWLTRVPNKIYTIRGLPFETSKGFKKKILILKEKIACFFADKVICISPSLKKKVIELNITNKEKIHVFGKGSSNGLQLDKFQNSIELRKKVKEIKTEYNFDEYNFIFGYVGRINSSKGINELVIAFESLQERYKKIALLLI